MNLQRYLQISPDVNTALRGGKAVVALESAVLSHGMPYPDNMAFAEQLEHAVRAEGAVPAIMAVVDGVLHIGLRGKELERICKDPHVRKLSRRDLPMAVALDETGATTVSTAMILACLTGIRVLATGGVGGVHRGAEQTMDVSADLQELRQTPVAVVCAGARMFLDVGLTLEYLETMGVPVLGLRTDEFPAFYCAKSGYAVDRNIPSEAEIARILKVKWDLGFKGGVVIGNPVPEQYALDFETMRAIVDAALEEAQARGVRGKDVTPFLLDQIAQKTNGVSLKTNAQVTCSNARAAAKIAVAYAALK